ncbi:NAD-dependent epimerase/dehydratase family protein [Nocardia panacis]|uniref:NAD-dependent epimerase/dehydratase family protein n=1 Tax=Nocardia panacis TaxID=2340916 RepID=A0A3A4KHX2_9NOCA|nr:NAD(P)H-binding protein [Nocardia panacis]RJO75776.1 NAD-dependent epimerase/dehydratase family protein [Nocardia panacis]
MTILVTGATGNIGRKVVDRLLARGADKVRALTKNPAAARLPAGVEAVEGYLRDVSTLPAAFAGVESVYLAPTPETAVDVLALAAKAGVRHVVDLSGEPESWWGGVSAAVENSGLAWTHLWPADFMENTRLWVAQIRATGTVREPNPAAATAPIAMDDIASVAAAALLEPGHEGKAHLLMGPQILTRAEMVRQLGAALGRQIGFVTASREESILAYTSALGAKAQWYVDNVLGYLGEDPQLPTESVAAITGTPGTTFAQWAARYAVELFADAPARALTRK